MNIKKEYYNVSICGVPYLLPYGQEIVSHVPNLRLNPSADFLWKALISGASVEELPSLLLEKYGKTEENLSLLVEDVDNFINMLKILNILTPEPPEPPLQRYPRRSLRIASLNLAFYGPDSLYETFFSDFSSTRKNSFDGELHCVPHAPSRFSRGKIVIRSSELTIAEDEEHYLFYFSAQPDIYEMQVTKDGRQTWLFFNFTAASDETLFHALRFAFLILAQKHGRFALHSASLLYRGKAWLFSAPSGTGKSTHTSLWQDEFKTTIINGDLNILGLNKNGVPTVYGLPWCGTSEIHSTARYPLGGIIFLTQSSENKVHPLAPYEQVLHLTQRMISPAWTEEMLKQNLNFAEKAVPRIFTSKLYCTPEPEAAVLIKKAIDAFLKKK